MKLFVTINILLLAGISENIDAEVVQLGSTNEAVTSDSEMG